MDLLQRQSYNLWFNWLADKVMQWKEAKPANTDLRNCMKAMNEIGMFNNGLQMEVQVLTKRIQLISNMVLIPYLKSCFLFASDKSG